MPTPPGEYRGSDFFEAPRDTSDTGFTDVLRAFLRMTPGALAIVLVDEEGECIDYCSRLDPYDIKVLGAEYQAMLGKISELAKEQGPIEMLRIESECDETVIWLAQPDFRVIYLGSPGSMNAQSLTRAEVAVRLLLKEAKRQVEVAIPRAAIWVESDRETGLPTAFYDHGERVRVEEVVGTWESSEGLHVLARTSDERELVFVQGDVWRVSLD